MVGPEIGDVKSLDSHRQRLESQRLLERSEGVDPLLAPALLAELVLGQRETGIPLGELAQPPLVAAFGNPDLDRPAAPGRKRLGEHVHPLGERRTHHHQPGHGGYGGVVLSDELLGDLGLAALALVGEIEALPLGEHAVAYLEYLGVRPGSLHRHRDQVGGLERLARDAAALHERAHRLEAIAIGGGALELLGVCRLGHLALQVALDVAVAARQEVDDRLNVPPVLLAVDVTDAGGLAALDVVVEAGNAGPAARLGSLARAVLEELSQEVERLADPPCAGERAEVDAPGPVALSREVDARELLVEAYPDVRIRLVVTEANVELGPVALDELLLGQKRLRLGLGDQEVDRSNPADEVEPPAMRSREMRRHALLDRRRLAHVQNAATGVLEHVDARLIGQLLPLLVEVLRVRHRYIKVRLPARWPISAIRSQGRLQ